MSRTLWLGTLAFAARLVSVCLPLTRPHHRRFSHTSLKRFRGWFWLRTRSSGNGSRAMRVQLVVVVAIEIVTTLHTLPRVNLEQGAHRQVQ